MGPLGRPGGLPKRSRSAQKDRLEPFRATKVVRVGPKGRFASILGRFWVARPLISTGRRGTKRTVRKNRLFRCRGRFLVDFGRLGVLPGAPRCPFRASGAPMGDLWALLGTSWEAPGDSLGASWGALGRSWGAFGPSGGSPGRPSHDFGPIWARFSSMYCTLPTLIPRYKPYQFSCSSKRALLYKPYQFSCSSKRALLYKPYQFSCSSERALLCKPYQFSCSSEKALAVQTLQILE